MGRNEECISQMSEAGTTELWNSRNLEWTGKYLTCLPPSGNSKGLDTRASGRNLLETTILKVSFITFCHVCVWVCECVCWCLGGQRPQIPEVGVTGGCELPDRF